MLSSASDAVYFSKYVSIDLAKSLLAVMQLIASGTMAYQISITFLLREKILAIMESLTTIYENRKILFEKKIIENWNISGVEK